MELKEAKALLEKYRTGKIGKEEKALVESWYLKYKAAGPLSPEALQEEHDHGLQALNAYLRKPNKTRLWSRIAAAAVIILAFGTGLYFYTAPHKGIKDKMTLAQDIPPGKNTAILMLANGETIKLSDLKTGVKVNAKNWSYNDDTRLGTGQQDQFAGVKQLAISTPRGGTYKITLPDGTLVILNAESTLRFPSAFSGKHRAVELAGEGYFEVAKDSDHPFIVQTNGQHAQVLGTHFNINAYPDNQSVKTTLVEGSLKIVGRSSEIVLRPGEQSTLTAGRIHVGKADVQDAVSWKEGYFSFNDEKIVDVMQKISRWYNIEVAYKGKVTEEGFTGTISRSSNISDVLDMLERTKAVNFEIKGRRVTVLN